MSRSQRFWTALAVMAALSGAVPASAAFSVSTTNTNASTLSVTSSFCPGYTPAWLTGMEHGAVSIAGGGLFDAWATAGGTPAVDALVPRSGSYSLKITKAGTGASNVARTLSTPNVAVARVALRLSSLPAGNVTSLLEIQATGGAGNLDIGYTSGTQKLSAAFSGGTAQPSATTITAGR